MHLSHFLSQTSIAFLEYAILLHDNTRLHTARVVYDLFDSCGLETLLHPPYSSGLSSCDFCLFPAFKFPMRGNRYSSVEDAFVDEIPTVPGRWDHVFEVEGEYFEGLIDLKIAPFSARLRDAP